MKRMVSTLVVGFITLLAAGCARHHKAPTFPDHQIALDIISLELSQNPPAREAICNFWENNRALFGGGNSSEILERTCAGIQAIPVVVGCVDSEGVNHVAFECDTDPEEDNACDQDAVNLVYEVCDLSGGLPYMNPT